MSTSTTDETTDTTSREVSKGVYRFGTRRINWYVLETEDGVTVIDAGLPAHWSQLGDWLDENGYDFADIAALVLTHADADHVGFATDLADHGVTVYCHPDDHHLLHSLPHGAPGWFYRNLWRPGFFVYAVEMVRDGITSVEPIEDVEPVVDGDVLAIPGEPRIINIPGHTSGSCALYVEDCDVLFSGDVLVTRNIFTGREGDPQLLGAADEDHSQATRSLARLEGLGTVTLLPGHGNPWHGEINEAIAHAR